MKTKSAVNALLLLSGLAVMQMPAAFADQGKFELKASTTMNEVMAEFTGKRVAVRLDSGEQIEGTVTMVGNSLAHISKLSGKDFYDAMVRIDKISTVTFKAR